MGFGVSWTFSSSSGICADGSAFGNPRAFFGTQCAFLQGKGTISQAFTVPADGDYVVKHFACERGFVDPGQDYDVLVDGAAIGRVSPSQLKVGQWTAISLPVTLKSGPHTLTFQGVNSKGGDHTAFLDSVTLTPDVGLRNPGFEDVPLDPKAFVYSPPAVTTPLVRLTARVATSGESIYGRMVKVADPTAYVPLKAVVTPPVIKVNGLPVAVASTVADAGHDGFLWLLPSKILAGDTVTVSAPLAWATVAGDFAAAMDETPIDNCAGRSYVGTDPTTATLRVGWNIAHGATPFWSTYSVNANLARRVMRWDPPGSVTANNANTIASALGPVGYSQSDIINTGNSNGIDATGVPVPEGLYAVGWGATTPSTTCSLVSDSGVVAERKDLANPGDASGTGQVRVFDCRRKPGAISATFDLKLRITDPKLAPNISYLACYGPKDFNPTAPVVLDAVTDPAALSQTYKDRLGPGIGSMRFVDSTPVGTAGGNACEPEYLLKSSRLGWFGWQTSWRVGFKSARPWMNAQSPYVYSPLFGEQFPATLGADMAASPAGTVETITVTDADTAPVIEGLELVADGERMRVRSVNGTTVKVERGSASTTPAAHVAGPIMVSGRVPMADLNSWKKEDICVFEVVCDGPHHLRTGNQVTMNGLCPYVFGTDYVASPESGTKLTLSYAMFAVWVTSPTTFVVSDFNGKSHANITLGGEVAFDPTKQFADIHIPEQNGIPYDVSAQIASRSGGDCHIAIPFSANDSFVDAVARQVRDNFPAGRRVYVEYNNEPWNWSYKTSHTQSRVGWMLAKQPDGQLYWQTRRLGQIAQRFIDRFNEGGINRGGEIRSLLNMQRGSGGSYRQYVMQSRAEGLPVPDPAIAPYTDIPPSNTAIYKAMSSCTMGQAIDLWIFNLAHGQGNRTGPIPDSKNHRAAVDAVNAEFGLQQELYAYECGVEESWPQTWQAFAAPATADDTVFHLDGASLYSPGQYLRLGGEWVQVVSIAGNDLTVTRGQCGTKPAAYAAGARIRNAYLECGRDLVYHPLFRIAEFDFFGVMQKYFSRINISVYSLDYVSAVKLWGMYHWLDQPAARGDGRDGKPDHSLLTAAPGSPGMKSPTVNQDLGRGSVRGQALIDWNRWAGANR